jgi:hypothetical protein
MRVHCMIVRSAPSLTSSLLSLFRDMARISTHEIDQIDKACTTRRGPHYFHWLSYPFIIHNAMCEEVDNVENFPTVLSSM